MPAGGTGPRPSRTRRGGQDGLRIREGVLDRMLALPKDRPPNKEDPQRIWQDVTRDVLGHPLAEEADQQSDADVDDEFGKVLETRDDEKPAAARPGSERRGPTVTLTPRSRASCA